MLKKELDHTQEEKRASVKIAGEVDQWFSRYFQAFIDIGASIIDTKEILKYWGVPLHSSSPKDSKWLNSPEEVVDVLRYMQAVLKQTGYTHTVAIDKKIFLYNENAARVDTIMSRRGAGDVEVDRAAVSFELRRADQDWIIISTTSKPSRAVKLSDRG